ncbi:MAG TPA: ATP-binding protein [Thermomicrobiales bacterium]|nr:ATP-binding protein [Thermomicrobiales bacterium]
MTPFRPSVRLKLTLLYGALFLIAGLFLISVTYGLVRRELAPNAQRPISRVVQDRPGNHQDGPDDRVAGARREERRFALRQLWRQSVFALAIATVGALGLGWLFAGQVLHPIRRITAHARSSSAATLDERIRLDGPEDELKELADTFDSMLDRLQAAFRAQQGFAAQASHELRTPLAIIRAEAELARDAPDASEQERQSADAILTAAGRSERLVDGLLALTRSESTMLQTAPVDLADLAGDVVGEYVREADQAGVRVDLALDAATVQGDPALLRQMIGNLVQNAIRYNRPDGWVRVSVAPTDRAGRLVVENSGQLVGREEIDRIFEPFARGEWARRNRTGFGLGLAIVRTVAIAHHGTIQALAGPDGGLRITIDILLPLQQ